MKIRLRKLRRYAYLFAPFLFIGILWTISTRWDIPWLYTQYAQDYTRQAFNEIAVGDSADSVRRRLGIPLKSYQASNIGRSIYSSGAMIDSDLVGTDEVVTYIVDPNNSLPPEIMPGTEVESVSWDFDKPIKIEYVNEKFFWHYSLPDGFDLYQRRIILLDRSGSRVIGKVTGVPWDEAYWFLSWDALWKWVKWG